MIYGTINRFYSGGTFMISIVVPTYNRCAMLEQALDSIMNQTILNIQIIVVDDCSDDNTENIMGEYSKKDKRITYIRNKANCGPGYNRNLGYLKSKGEYIIFMDDDDYYTDNLFFQKAIDKFSESPELACVSGNAVIENVVSHTYLDTDIGFVGRKYGIDYLLELNHKYRKPMSTFSTVFSKKVLDNADLSNMKMVNDIAIYMRALLYGDVYVLESKIGVYRVHNTNISNSITRDFLIENLKERLWVYKILENMINKKKASQWLSHQIIFCYSYYIRGTHPSRKEAFNVAMWILFHIKPTFCLYKGISLILLRDNKRKLY